MSGAPLVIVGGGMSGLAAAYELTRRKVPFLLLEAAPTLGGVVKTERIDGFMIDAGPDALLTQKPAAIDLCRQLGIGGRLRPQIRRGTFLVRGGRLRAMPEASVFGIPTDGTPFVTTRAFSLRGKLRMAAEYVLPGRPAAGDESIAAFIGRRFGREVEGRAPADCVLVRAYLGGARDPGAIDLSSDAIVARAHRDVSRLLNVTGDPVLARIDRWPHTNAQMEVGHLGLMAQIDERLAAHPGLFVSAAGFRGSVISDCVADGRRQAATAAAAAPQRLTA